jgi:hypothetical protein
MRTLAAQIDYDLVLMPMSSSASFAAIETVTGNTTDGMGNTALIYKADIVLGFTSITADRQATADFTTPYITTGYQLFMKDLIVKGNGGGISAATLLQSGLLLIISILFITIVGTTIVYVEFRNCITNSNSIT